MRNPSIKVTDKELQRKFNQNEGGYPARMASLRRVCIYDRPANSKSHQRVGTRSRLYKYFDGDTPVMYLHCFVELSGKLGASSKMDPKRLLIDGVYYYCD
jgi:hypothetical protein